RKNYFYSYPPYPLPAGEVVQAKIFWDLALDINTAEIKVYDVYGKEISDGKDIIIIPETGWSGTLVWNCKGVTPGVYLITINYGTERKVIKVVKG
ncbi:MAG TPA: T9SS type A sorting domain-containing protein, partial [Candidatus Kapabacteria bacterium]|nr:T9SS type A sorting domain-containing protein [Candidatus Kapabacteria bacterium]